MQHDRRWPVRLRLGCALDISAWGQRGELVARLSREHAWMTGVVGAGAIEFTPRGTIGLPQSTGTDGWNVAVRWLPVLCHARPWLPASVHAACAVAGLRCRSGRGSPRSARGRARPLCS